MINYNLLLCFGLIPTTLYWNQIIIFFFFLWTSPVKRHRWWKACSQYAENEKRLLWCCGVKRILNMTGFNRAAPLKKGQILPKIQIKWHIISVKSNLLLTLSRSPYLPPIAWGRIAFTGELVRALTWSTVSELSKQMVQGEIECSSCLPRPKASNYCLILAGGLNNQNYHRCMHRVEWMCGNLSLRVWKQKIRL